MAPNLFGRSIRVFSRQCGRPSVKVSAGQHAKGPFAKNVSLPFYCFPSLVIVGVSFCFLHSHCARRALLHVSSKSWSANATHFLSVSMPVGGGAAKGAYSQRARPEVVGGLSGPRPAYERRQQGRQGMDATHDTSAGRTRFERWASRPPSAQLLHPVPWRLL